MRKYHWIANNSRFRDARQRFWLRVKKTSYCWLWKGSTDKDGYGLISVGQKPLKAHRYSYMLHKGLIPTGLIIRHSCDNPRCVNPDHLLVGTYKENTQDAVKRKRMASGVRNGNVLLTTAQVRKVQKYEPDGKDKTIRKLAELLNVSVGTVEDIRYGRTWKHLIKEKV